MMQFLAILNDSLRDLRSRSLFWVTLIISIATPVILFGFIGFNDKGWHVLWFETHESATLQAGTAGQHDFLRWLFGGALLWWWLTWGAILIALIVSSGTVPEFISSGSIDLVLAKPMSRMRLYLVKLFGALLFTLLQVTTSVLIAYLLAGVRFGLWFHAAWLAVPLVALQFLYLFSVMSLVGLVTRSTLASLLAVLLFWGMVSLVQFAANEVDKQIVQARKIVNLSDERSAQLRERVKAEGRELTAAEESRIRRFESQAEPFRNVASSLEPWQRPINAIELLVPKTGDIQKIIAEKVDAPTFSELILRLQGMDPEVMAKFAGAEDGEQFRDMQRAGAAGDRAARTVNPYISIGSSLAFTLVVLGLSLWIFARRDF